MLERMNDIPGGLTAEAMGSDLTEAEAAKGETQVLPETELQDAEETAIGDP